MCVNGGKGNGKKRVSVFPRRVREHISLLISIVSRTLALFVPFQLGQRKGERGGLIFY